MITLNCSDQRPQSASSACATGDSVSSRVPHEDVAQPLRRLAVQRLDVDHLGVDPVPGEVEHVADAAGHAGGDVPPGRAEDHRAAAGHVLQRVVADALDDGQRAGVADAEPLADPAAQEDLPAGRAVADDVAGDDVVLGGERRLAGRPDDDPPAGQALADVVVGVAVAAAS